MGRQTETKRLFDSLLEDDYTSREELDEQREAEEGATGATRAEAGATAPVGSIILTPNTLREELGLTPEQMERFEYLRKTRQQGKPIGATKGKPKLKPKYRATFLVSQEMIMKLRYIAITKPVMYTDLITSIFNDYITKWEEENGKIVFPKRIPSR